MQVVRYLHLGEPSATVEAVGRLVARLGGNSEDSHPVTREIHCRGGHERPTDSVASGILCNRNQANATRAVTVPDTRHVTPHVPIDGGNEDPLRQLLNATVHDPCCEQVIASVVSKVWIRIEPAVSMRCPRNVCDRSYVGRKHRSDPVVSK
jgi:hypothetical protein